MKDCSDFVTLLLSKLSLAADGDAADFLRIVFRDCDAQLFRTLSADDLETMLTDQHRLLLETTEDAERRRELAALNARLLARRLAQLKSSA